MRQTRVIRIHPQEPAAAAIHQAARIIRDGGLVVFPTETVYGLGADALNASAVRAIFEAKGRPATDPLIVHVAGLEQLTPLVGSVPPAVKELADRFWPGPLTLILPKLPAVPDEVTAGLTTVALRVPAHPVAQALIAAAARPIAAPSANLFSRPSPTAAAHVLADLDGRVDMVLDAGPTEIGVESTVLDLTMSPPLVRRPGGVSVEALRLLLPDVQVASHYADDDRAQLSPGQLLRHYAPRAPMTLIDGEPAAARLRLLTEAHERLAAGRRVGILAPEDDIAVLVTHLSTAVAKGDVVPRGFGSRTQPERAARELFDAIRALDAEGPDDILAISLPAEGIGRAVHDRLLRAAEGRVLHVRPATVLRE
jgi:L-threonylcarbamoyladenylate synthase